MTSNKHGQAALLETVQEFAHRLDELYGLYLDTTQGFRANIEKLEKTQEEVRKSLSNPTTVDQLPFIIGRGDPNDPNNVILHQTTQGQFKARNALGGANHRLLSQYLIVLIFHLWEQEYRPRIALLLGLKEAGELKLPIFGDIRILRNEILKHRGILTKETIKKLQIIGGLGIGQVINFSDDDVELLIRAIKAALDQVVHSATGNDPKFRTLWHVQ